MKTIYTIPAKMSNSGSIHDIADTIDRDITFQSGCKYAVILSSYYGGKGYTTHKSAESAIKKSKELTRGDYSHKIIDTEGNSYGIEPNYYQDELVKINW
jgi:hypothetical protein